jgi:hypothetical protein
MSEKVLLLDGLTHITEFFEKAAESHDLDEEWCHA